MGRVERVWDKNGHAGQAEDAHQHRQGIHDFFSADGQGRTPTQNGEVGCEPPDDMLFRIQFDPAAAGEKGQQREKYHKTDDEDPGAPRFAELDARGQKGDQREEEKRKLISKVPEKHGASQKTGIENQPGAWIKALDKRFSRFVSPGDQHGHPSGAGVSRLQPDSRTHDPRNQRPVWRCTDGYGPPSKGTRMAAKMALGPAAGMNSPTIATAGE